MWAVQASPVSSCLYQTASEKSSLPLLRKLSPPFPQVRLLLEVSLDWLEENISLSCPAHSNPDGTAKLGSDLMSVSVV